jgi:hypothetical protein
MEDKGNEKFMQMAIDLSEYNVKQAQGGPFGVQTKLLRKTTQPHMPKYLLFVWPARSWGLMI